MFSDPKEYREERTLFIRIDEILSNLGLEGEFITLAMEHQGLDLTKESTKEIENFCRNSILALRTNIARHFKRMGRREFCIRPADSPLLQWFLQTSRSTRLRFSPKAPATDSPAGSTGAGCAKSTTCSPPCSPSSASKRTTPLSI